MHYIEHMKANQPFRVLWLIIFIGILFCLPTLISHLFEPRYQGKRLTVWVNNLPAIDLRGDEVMTEAIKKVDADNAAAFQYFGTRTIPVAIKLGRVSDSKFKEKLIDWNDAWNNAHQNHQIHFVDAEAEESAHARSRQIFRILGPVGAPAIPGLIELLSHEDSTVVNTASENLFSIGTNAIPPLIGALADRNPQRRRLAAGTLGRYKSRASAALPSLLLCLKDNDHQMRNDAAVAVAEIGADASTAVPTLVEALKREKYNSYCGVFSALAKYGTNAQAAVPFFIYLIKTQPKPAWFKNPALDVLQKIDPEAAAPFTNQTH
jgi:HEAT repeat protein